MSTKTTIREIVADAVDTMRKQGLSDLNIDCEASEVTIKNYLNDSKLKGEKLECQMDKEGVFVIYRTIIANQGISKRQLLGKLRAMRHLDSWELRHDELDLSPSYALNVIGAESSDGIHSRKFLKAAFDDFIYIFCLHFSAAEKITYKEGDRKLLDELQPKPQPTPTLKPESPTTWLERQLCRLFLDELEGKLTFKPTSIDQRIQYKALARDYQVNPYRFGGMDFSITYDYGKEALIMNRKSIRRGKWHRDSVVGRSSVRRGKSYAHWFDAEQLPSEMLHSVRRNRGLLDHAQDLWFEILKVDGEIGCTVKMNHNHGAPKTETGGSRLERDTWEAAQIMRIQPEVQVFPIWWAAADVESLLAEHGLESLKVKEIHTPDGEHNFSLIYR